MKRSRSNKEHPCDELGALEFASILNSGEDARAILSTLGRFSKTIRRQRRQALLANEDNAYNDYSSEDSDSSVSEDNDAIATRKRPRKHQDWMEDTADFNVPFVGTSMAKGDTGRVLKGEWPTGFLEAYLKASPMAVELTSGELIPPSGHVHKRLLSHNYKQGKKASQAIYRAFLKALAELVTADVPISTLQRDYNVQQDTQQDESSSPSLSRDSLVSIILRDMLPGFMTLLNQETGGGKLMDRPLVAAVLKVLANLAAASLGAAREVTRALDASLKDGILKSLLRSRRNTQHDKKQENDGEDEEIQQVDDSVRIECLRLTSVLVEWQDAAITSFIATKGSRERKVNAGVLFLALKLGFHDSLFEHEGSHDDDEEYDERYVHVVARLLHAVERLLPDPDRGPTRPLLSTRDLVDLFAGDTLVHLSQIALCAPSLTESESFQHILSDNGEANLRSQTTPLEEAGVEGRRMLFSFLANPQRSPFLSRINNEKVDDKSADHCIQQLVRAMMLLFQRQPSLSMQRFLVYCLQTTPILVQTFFKLVTVPDPTNNVFPFIARMGFLFRLVREAPPVTECIVKAGTSEEQSIDGVVACIVPANVKKHIMSKALQSTNAMIVSGVLKLLCALVDRYQGFLGHYGSTLSDEARHLLADAFIRRLPDMQPLLSVRSRFDPFSPEGESKASTVVIGFVCKVLDSYAKHLPQRLDSVKFDWTKLLPSTAKIFCSSSSVLQFQLLQTLENILAIQEGNADRYHLSTAAIRVVLEIMMTASRTEVYQKARSVALEMIRSTVKSADAETRSCIDYEPSLLIDGLSVENIDEFCSLLTDPNNNRFQHGMTIADAWNPTIFDDAMPPVCFSPLVTTLLATIGTSSSSFQLFACQVLSRCLLFQRHPLPLASIVATKLAGIDSIIPIANLLLQYAQTLINDDDTTSDGRLSLLVSALDGLFSPDCLQNVVMKSLVDDTNLDLSKMHDFSDCDIAAAIRQCLHVSTLRSNTSDTTQSIMKLRTLVPLVDVHDSDSHASNSHLDTILRHPLVTMRQYPWLELAYLKAVTLCLQGCSHSTQPSKFTLGEDSSDLNELREGEDAHVVSLKNVLLHSLMVPVLSNGLSTQTMGDILRRVHNAANDHDRHAFSSLALYWFEKQRNGGQSVIPLIPVLDTWHSIVETCEPAGHTVRLARQLESFLSVALVAKDGEVASLAYSLFLKRPPEVTFEICLRSKRMKHGTEGEASVDDRYPSLLSSLIDIDPMLFGTSFLSYLDNSIEESSTRRLLEDGAFDEEIAALSKCSHLLTTETFEKVRDAIVMRSFAILSVEPGLQSQTKTHSIKNDLTALLCIPGVLLVRHVEPFAEKALESLRQNSKPRLLHDTSTWYQLSRILLCGEGGVLDSQPRLSSAVLVHAFQMIHPSLKGYFRPSPKSKSNGSSAQACFEVLVHATRMLMKRQSHDNETLTSQAPEAAAAAIKASLKYGLAHSVDKDADVSARCFQFVRTLLVEVFDPSSPLHVLKSHCILLEPSTISTLILSHSHFYESLSSSIDDGQDCTTGESAKLELVRLLLVCTSLSGKVVFERGTWDALLASYNAGTTELDILLRRLLRVYVDSLSNGHEKAGMPFLGTLKWKGMSPSSHEDTKGAGWDWLANGIDTSRIRTTLAQFPVHDRVNADPIMDVEVWLDGTDTAEDTSSESSDLDIAMETDSVSTGSDSNMDDVSDERSLHERKHARHVIDVDAWTAEGRDVRYSPAFLLPLILAAIENSFSTSDLSRSTNSHGTLMKYERDAEQKQEDESPSIKEFVLLAQRLCEKGCLSLALASLCSECSSLRKIAVATLSHMKRALDTREARKLTTWRERPQLAMIVDSVQRGLAVRMALRTDPQQASLSIHIPKLPAMSAIFLARAAFIIVKPGDSMFGPMNRYFLRLDNGHGAFQDTNRIPAFISLFCSSSDDPGQARRERLWAMQLVKDSFVEEYCYRFVETCHAPELLLTSFENMNVVQENEQYETDAILALDTLAVLLQNGGRRATSHLIGRLGLLSWIRGQLVSGGVLHILPSLEGRIAFLRLIRTALVMARRHLDDDEDSERQSLLLESNALVYCTGRLCGDSIECGLFESSEQKDASKSESFIALTSDVLDLLVRLTIELESNQDLLENEASGISLSTALHMLRMTPPALLTAMISSLCTIPLRPGSDTAESIEGFSKLVLSALARSDLQVNAMINVLNRVTRLLPLSEPLTNDAVLGALLACRPRSLKCCREAWFECLQAVVRSTAPNDSSLLCTGKDILDSASLYARN